MALRKVAPTLFRRADDEAAFERLYERHVEGVYRYALAMLGDAADAEDVTQTTFLNAYRAFKGGTRPEKPSSWLIAIAHNVCRQRFRQAQRRPREVAFDEGIGEAEVLEPAGPSADELRRALSQLPANQRAALVMRELEGSSYAEIAGVLGVSVSALETLLFRARRALREQLEEQISCQEAALAVNRQLDGRLSMGERRALRAHLRACPACHSLAQSQRAQRRALKSLVLVPLPLTIAHWSGAQSASAATSAGGLAAIGATTGGAGTASVVLGGAGVAAKVAAVVVAGVVVGGTYEGVTHAARGTSKPTNPAALAPAQPGVGVPVADDSSLARAIATGAAARRANAHRAGANGSGPGQSVKAVARTEPHALRENPPGHAISAAHSQSAEHSKSREHAHGATRPHAGATSNSAASQSVTHSQAGARTRSASHARAATHSQGSASSQAAAAHTQSQTRDKAATASQPAAHSQAPGRTQSPDHSQSQGQASSTPSSGQSGEPHGNSSSAPPGNTGNADQRNADNSPPGNPGNGASQDNNPPATTTATTATPS